jgi:iron complex outermembrane receptor protein
MPIQPKINNSYWGVSAETNLELGPVTLTYIGSHRELKRDEDLVQKIGPAPTPTLIKLTNKEDSHELRFATNDREPLFIQAGAYYFQEKGNYQNLSYDNAISSGTPFSINRIFSGQLAGATAFGFNHPKLKARNYSLFGQAVYSLVPSLRVTGGIRYSNDLKSRFGGSTFQRSTSFATGDIFLPYASTKKSSKVTWRAGLDWDAGDTTLVYAAIATGYKAGGLNDGCLAGSSVNGVLCNAPQVARPANLLTYEPETITSYEGGIKTRFLDNRLSLSLSAYHYDYKNLQLLIAAPVGGGVSVAFYGNAPKAKVDGVELEGSAQITDTTLLDFSLTHTNARYIDYSPFAGFNFRGAALDRAPKFVLGANLSQDVPLGGSQRLRFSVGTRWSDEYFLSSFGLGFQVRQSSFFKSDASITFSDTNSKLVIQAFVRNIEDNVEKNFYLQGAGYIPSPDPTRSLGGVYNYLDTGVVGFGAPRTFGLRVSKGF